MAEQFKSIIEKHGTPVLVVDHEIIKANYMEFKTNLPNVQVYYAVKANPDKEILKTLFELGASFDVASFEEFSMVHEFIKDLPDDERHQFIYDKIIYANTIKPIETLKKLNPYRPLVTYDNIDELKKIKKHCPKAGLVIRIKVPNTGSMVELSSKFGIDPGDAVDLVVEAFNLGLVVEGLSFHVGSQCTNFENFVQALNLAASIFKEAKSQGHELKILDIGGGFPAPYDDSVKPFKELSNKISSEIERLFPKDIEIFAEPGRFIVATSATLFTKIIGKSIRDGKLYYYINDGVYHSFSGVVFDHCQYHFNSFKDGQRKICAVVGQTCDAFDSISLAEELPELEIEDILYTENIGAYSTASSTNFNGFPPAKVVHVNK
ncbi:MAG: type III PLP-dependent enzyme [Candidatus Woesearchaeota archaeon]|jgi:ornithine decarboxylase|nr:decarboxylase [Gammaproteobacteria bacterium]MDP7179916.1 type III PLP-dependent enzyme [Candidatus Woesearchaeota archaeon]